MLNAANVKILKMPATTIHSVLTYGIAAVWFINGFVCKILDLVPRHEKIVARILGAEYAQVLTVMIGAAEVMMAVWILSGLRTRLNSIIQVVVVITMNVIEYALVPDLLLWGRWNILFALMFVLVVFFNEFFLIRYKSAA